LDFFKEKLSLLDRALEKLHSEKVSKRDYDSDKNDLGYKSASAVFDDMKAYFDNTMSDYQHEMQGVANKNLNEYALYAKTVGSTTKEVTNECIERQRTIDMKVKNIERMLEQIVDEQGNINSAIGTKKLSTNFAEMIEFEKYSSKISLHKSMIDGLVIQFGGLLQS